MLKDFKLVKKKEINKKIRLSVDLFERQTAGGQTDRGFWSKLRERKLRSESASTRYSVVFLPLDGPVLSIIRVLTMALVHTKQKCEEGLLLRGHPRRR